MNIKKLLRENVLIVTFIKKNGEEREMVCTLREDIIPKTTGERNRNLDEKYITVFDVEKDDWRNINTETIIKVEVC